MDMNSVLLAAIGGGAGGALGGALAGLLARPLSVDWRRWIVIFGVVAGAVIGGRFAPMVLAARTPSAGDVEAALLADPGIGQMASAWRARDPQSFTAFAQRLAPAAQGGPAAAIEQARAELSAAARPLLVHLGDAQLVEMIRMSRDQMRELAQTHPVACHPLFHGRRFGDITPYLSADIRAREIALLTAAFSADENVGRATLEGAALSDSINRVVESVRADFGEDIALIAPDAQVEGREQRVCEAAAAVYDRMQALPENEAAALMRGLTELAN